MNRGESWSARLPEPFGSEPEFRRPVLIIQSDRFNRSQIGTVIAAAVTRYLRLRIAPATFICQGGPGVSTMNRS